MGSGTWRGRGLSSMIGLAEGFETARAWSILNRLPCWATFGSRRLDLVTIPDTVTTLILAGDPDLAGRRAMKRAFQRYEIPNRVIREDVPPGRSDWAKVLEAQERGEGGRG